MFFSVPRIVCILHWTLGNKNSEWAGYNCIECQLSGWGPLDCRDPEARNHGRPQGRRFSKDIMTRHAKNLGVMPPWIRLWTQTWVKPHAGAECWRQKLRLKMSPRFVTALLQNSVIFRNWVAVAGIRYFVNRNHQHSLTFLNYYATFRPQFGAPNCCTCTWHRSPYESYTKAAWGCFEELQ